MNIEKLVIVVIYNVIVIEIKLLINKRESSEYYSLEWNATNIAGETVFAGMHFYYIESGDFRSTTKMVLLN